MVYVKTFSLHIQVAASKLLLLYSSINLLYDMVTLISMMCPPEYWSNIPDSFLAYATDDCGCYIETARNTLVQEHQGSLLPYMVYCHTS